MKSSSFVCRIRAEKAEPEDLEGVGGRARQAQRGTKKTGRYQAAHAPGKGFFGTLQLVTHQITAARRQPCARGEHLSRRRCSLRQIHKEIQWPDFVSCQFSDLSVGSMHCPIVNGAGKDLRGQRVVWATVAAVPCNG